MGQAQKLVVICSRGPDFRVPESETYMLHVAGEDNEANKDEEDEPEKKKATA